MVKIRENITIIKNLETSFNALPADRHNEVDDCIIDGPHSIINDEAENRLHIAKGVMALTMGGRGRG